MFFKYLKRRAGDIFLIGVFSVIFAGIFALFDLEPAAVGYGAMLCAAVTALFVFFDYRRFSAYCGRLAVLKNEITLTLDNLPVPHDPIGKEYTELIKELFSELRHVADMNENRRRETDEYYTVWVHQIKTPISAMRLLLSERDDEESKELLEELFRIEQYVEMVMIRLRLGSDSTDYVLRECNINKITRTAVRKFAPQFIRKKLGLHYNVPDLKVITDEKWLSFVIEQLLSNSLKYTSCGTISIYMREPLTLVISDTGIGISSEDLPRIFENGYTGLTGRLDKKASGIGLYLCRMICDRLGHRIYAESAVGEGTSVMICLDSVKIKPE